MNYTLFSYVYSPKPRMNFIVGLLKLESPFLWTSIITINHYNQLIDVIIFYE